MQWGLGEITLLREMRERGSMFNDIVWAWQGAHDRAEVVEAVDALRRYDDDAEALDHVNRVLDQQVDGVALINGWPAWEVLHGINAAGVIPERSPMWHGSPLR